mgnify:CR=1 FL=1
MVTDLHGSKLYIDAGSRDKKYIFGNNFASGIYFNGLRKTKIKGRVKLLNKTVFENKKEIVTKITSTLFL